MSERILCAAIRVETGREEDGARSFGYPETGFVFCGLRHGDCIKVSHAWWARLSDEEREAVKAANGGHHSRWQGFLTSSGRYVDRVEAQVIALRMGQVQNVKGLRGGILFSEDLY